MTTTHPAWCAQTESPDEVHESSHLYASEDTDFVAIKAQRIQADEGDEFPILVLTMKQDGEEAQYGLMPQQARRLTSVIDELLALQSQHADEATDNGDSNSAGARCPASARGSTLAEAARLGPDPLEGVEIRLRHPLPGRHRRRWRTAACEAGLP